MRHPVDVRQPVENQSFISTQNPGGAKPFQAAHVALSQATKHGGSPPANTYASDPPNMDGVSFSADEKGVEFKMKEKLELNIHAGKQALKDKWNQSTPCHGENQ